MIWLQLACFCVVGYNVAEAVCSPNISELSGNAHVGGFILSSCKISTCKEVSNIVYEKTDVTSPLIWRPVYEINVSNHHVVDLDSKYNLKERTEYAVLSDTHYVEIKNVSLQDQGTWRCVVYDHNNVRYVSNLLPLIIQDADCAVRMHIAKIDFKGAALIDCITLSCENILKLQYEKNDIASPTTWVPVYEYIDESNHRSPNTETKYTLRNRSNAIESFARYTLIIEPMILEDQGLWRCVIYDSKDKQVRSNIQQVNIFGKVEDTLAIVEDSTYIFKSTIVLLLIGVASVAVAALIITYVICCCLKCCRRQKQVQDKGIEYYNTQDYYLYSSTEPDLETDGSYTVARSAKRASYVNKDVPKEEATYEELD